MKLGMVDVGGGLQKAKPQKFNKFLWLWYTSGGFASRPCDPYSVRETERSAFGLIQHNPPGVWMPLPLPLPAP